MKLEPRPQEVQRPLARRGLDVALDRLALMGYRIDSDKWRRFLEAGLVTPPLDGERGERDAVSRLRKVLDVERTLGPWGDLDALSFYLVAAGDGVISAGPVGRFIQLCVVGLFDIGDRIQLEVQLGDAPIGPDGEVKFGRTMARYALRDLRIEPKRERAAVEALLGAVFVGYVRSTFAMPRPSLTLHVSSRLVNLEAQEARPVKRTEEPLPPLAEREKLVAWLSTQPRLEADAVLRAARNATALIRLCANHFPEVQTPWRDVAAEAGPQSAMALQALAIVPGVLAAAFLQAGRATAELQLERPLERLMHYWGTFSFEAVRFELSNGAFPWVGRTAPRALPPAKQA